jgi:hypothetical protein
MSVSGVGGGFSAASLLDLQQTSQTSSIGGLLNGISFPTANAPGSVSGTSAGDSVSISGPGKLFGQLQQLQAQSPAEFQQVTGQIAAQLQTAAQQSSGVQANFLTNLANKFQTASTTGNVSVLQPPQSGSFAGTYNAQGQVAQSLLSALNSSDSSSSSGGFDIAQLLGGGAASSGVDLSQLLGGTSSSSDGTDIAQLLGGSSASSSGGLDIAQLLGGGSSASSGTALTQLLAGTSSSSGGFNLAQLVGGSAATSNGADLGQLFQSISQEVNQAVGGKS